MSAADIKALREAGNFVEALDMARAEYKESPDDPWTLNSLVWVDDAVCKASAEEGRLDVFCAAFNDIVSLNVLDSNEILNNSLCWRFLSLTKTISSKLKDNEIQDAGNILFSLAKELHPQIPSKQYSILLQAFLKLKEKWNGFYGFFEWWGFRNFTEEDYESRRLSNGKTMMSVAEEAFLASSKCLLKKKNLDDIKTLISELEYVNEKYPRMTYIGYYIGKLLLCIGDRNNALDKLLPFAKKKKDEFWIWQLLSETQNDDNIRLACLMRAEKCRTQNDYLVNVRQALAKELIKQGDYETAKKQIEKLVLARSNNNWKLPDEVQSWIRSDWYNKPIDKSKAINIDYMTITNDLLFSDMEEFQAIVSFVNVEKKIATVITGNKQIGFFNFERFHLMLKVGNVLNIRANNQSGYINVVSLRKVDSIDDNDYYKTINAIVSSTDEGRLYVEYDSRRLFLSDQVLKGVEIEVGEELTIKILFDFNKKYEKWGWRCISIKKV